MKQFLQESKAWPFIEAKALIKQCSGKEFVLFETGYGPSGLPHIGTFGEVARTTMVRKAFEAISDIPTKLFAFSDDMDGLRKVPDNLPNKEMLEKHLGKPLTAIPDPFGEKESFGHYMNAKLREFLDKFGFEYEFKSATECYKSGLFDKTLLKILEHYEEIINVVLPTLGEERRKTYSPFLPICKKTGKVLQAPVSEINKEKGTIIYTNEDGEKIETLVTGGKCKLQWKVDWAMRWDALGVDYEMHGKDLNPSYDLSARICKIIGGTPPKNFRYELFLDEQGKKISKSKGNGISLEDWLKYAPQESLSYYMFQSPGKAKRLHFDIIPKCVDEYLTFLKKYPEQEEAKQVANPVWHVHSGNPPAINSSLSFALLLNLASACNPENKDILWGFITKYEPSLTPENAPFLDSLTEYAVRYYYDFIKPTKKYREPTDMEREALTELKGKLKGLESGATAEEIQNIIYAIGKEKFDDLKGWFKALYEILLGQTQGPRMGSFIALYGVDEMIGLIEEKIN